MKLTFLHNASATPFSAKGSDKVPSGFESQNETEVFTGTENLSFSLLLLSKVQSTEFVSLSLSTLTKNPFCPKFSASRQKFLIKSLCEEIRRSYLENKCENHYALLSADAKRKADI